jgi:hypothetical protein
VSPGQASGRELAAGLLKALAALRLPPQQQAAAARRVMQLSGSDRLWLALLYVFVHDGCQRRSEGDVAAISQLLVSGE